MTGLCNNYNLQKYYLLRAPKIQIYVIRVPFFTYFALKKIDAIHLHVNAKQKILDNCRNDRSSKYKFKTLLFITKTFTKLWISTHLVETSIRLNGSS